MGFFERLPDTFIIFDTEFTAWEGSMQRNWSGENEYKELVQISAFRIKKKGNNIAITKKLNIYVLPRINRNLSEYFIELTGITQEIIEKKVYLSKRQWPYFTDFAKMKKMKNIHYIRWVMIML